MGDGLQAIEALQAQLNEQAAALASLQHDLQAANLAKAGVTPADVEWKVLTSAFVFMMQLKTKQPASKWVMAGVAMLLATD